MNRTQIKIITTENDALVINKIPKNFAADIFATGGFGRSEMYPYSDLDLLIVLPNQHNDTDIKHAQQFVQKLWDTGAEISHSIRTYDQCIDDAKTDIHFFTALLESRVLYGEDKKINAIIKKLKTEAPYKGDGFLNLKVNEQQTRHEQFEDNLEPNIKNCPGGMRDIQTLNWLARFYDVDLKNQEEQTHIEKAYDFLMEIRLQLHLFHQKSHNNLSFEDQKRLADYFSYENDKNQLAVEKFMQTYYRHCATIEFYNELVIQSMNERLSNDDSTTPINDDFLIHNGFIDTYDPELFIKRPECILAAFNLIAENEGLKGFKANVIRSLRDSRKSIGHDYFNSDENINAFKQLIGQPRGVTRQFLRLNRYDLLGAMIPLFDDIKGQMQFDLFHRKTVDQHSIATIKECSKLRYGLYKDTLPFATDITKALPNVRVLFIAALFHDIGKGRGVDHSEYGCDAVTDFCKQLKFPENETSLCAFLIKQHLTMSQTSQKMDISDTVVIKRFASIVDSPEKLNYLYVLTVSDIRATNLDLFNSWKDSLLQNLYHATNKYLTSTDVISQDELKTRKIKLISDQPDAEHVIQSLPNAYFAHFKNEDIDWQLRRIINQATPVIALRHHPKHQQLECLIYLKRQHYLFAKITATIDRLNLNVAQANFYVSGEDQALYHLVILNAKNKKASQHQSSELAHNLIKTLNSSNPPEPHRRRVKRKKNTFDIKTSIQITQHDEQPVTIIDINCQDRHGLLASITRHFAEHEIILHQAKIVTLGEQVEDRFFVSTLAYRPINDETTDKLKVALSSL